jgi:hypothetical protein
MNKPKFEIGQKLFYKGHLHCTIMDIIQENFIFTYEINMTLNNRNKIVDEWDLFENKEKARFKNEPKIKQPKFVPYSPSDEFLEQKTLKKEIKELKDLIERLIDYVVEIRFEKQIYKSRPIQPIVKNVLKETIDNLKVGQKRTLNRTYTLDKINDCINRFISKDKVFHIIELSKGSGTYVQVYRQK